MSKYRFKTEEEFKAEGFWNEDYDAPDEWSCDGGMNHFLGQPVDDSWNDKIESSNKESFKKDDCYFNYWNFIQIEEEVELPIEEIMKQIETNNQNSLINKKEMNKSIKVTENVKASENFVFMDKTASVLEIGFSTCKNLVLYGPGGHGKSEMTLDFLKQKGISPYVITMGTGMTTDRLFGGMDIQQFHSTGRIEYLVENSFMNHEYVVFEEMMDAPDFILEQLKDILSSGIFRNGTQVYNIKTKFIICCTNRTREEFSKNMSLKALMERFPLELNVVWDNYTEISYNKLLESKFGVDNVDPIIPYLLQEYAKNGIIISPRIAVVAYSVYDECGPEALSFIAEFTKKPALIAETIKKFEATIKFRELSTSLNESMQKLNVAELVTRDDEEIYRILFNSLKNQLTDIRGLAVSDDLASIHAQLVKTANAAVDKFNKNLTIAEFI